ncbi:MAG: TlpA disulfide reductase family protein [Actinomycetota bacterium]
MTNRSACHRIVMMVAASALGLAACGGNAPPKPGHATQNVDSPGVSRFAPADRHLAPNLSGTTLEGSQFALDDIAGNIVVVNVWASWCAPCRIESPVLAGLERQLGAQKVRFVGIDEADTSSSARQFVASAAARYPQLVDEDGAILGRLTLLPQKGIPSTLILDRHHRMAARVIGPVTSQQIHTLVSELLLEG